MKQTYKSRLKAVIACMAGFFLLVSCQNDDERLPKAFAIATHVNGYIPEDGKADTRGSINGTTFSFSTGDAIGVIALRNGSVMNECNNVRLTYRGGTWSGADIYDWGADKYIAYYPYRSDMAGKTSVDAIKSAFPIQNDQSTEANFNASNLMTATATVSGGNLKFNFTPAFAMVEVTVPDALDITATIDGKNYPYKIYGSGSATYTTSAPSLKKDKTLRRIIKPSVSTEIKATCNIENIPCVTYTKNVNIGQGILKKLILNGKINRNLETGDLVYNSGGTIAFFPGSATGAPTANCVGVIIKVGQGKSDTPSNYDGKLSSIHGYALAIQDANNGNTCIWSEREVLGYTSLDATDYLGYQDTQSIKRNGGNSFSTKFPAAYQATTYPVSLPSGTSGWYLISAGQAQAWFDNRDKILSSLRKAIGNPNYNTNRYYSTTTEVQDVPSDVYRRNLIHRILDLHSVEHEINYSYKDAPRFVRSCMTF